MPETQVHNTILLKKQKKKEFLDIYFMSIIYYYIS